MDESIDTPSVDAAKEAVEEALETLDDAIVNEHIERVEETASIASDLAQGAALEADRALNETANIREELITHEESDEWLRQQVVDLSDRMKTLEAELSTLKASQIPAPVIQEVPETPILDETITLETPQETLSETKTERQENVEEESPAVEAQVETRQRKARLLV